LNTFNFDLIEIGYWPDDQVKREILYKILIEFGIPRLIKTSLTEAHSSVRVGKNV